MNKQYYLIFLILITVNSCATVKMYAPEKYMASCHPLMSDESCIKEAADNCTHGGYKVIYKKKDSAFGSRKYIAIGCNEQIDSDKRDVRLKVKEVFSKLKEQGYIMSTSDDGVIATRNGKVFKLTDHKYLCSVTDFDLAAAEAKGYAISSTEDEFFLVKGDNKILLSSDKKHLCKRI